MWKSFSLALSLGGLLALGACDPSKAELDATKTQLASITAERDSLKGQVDMMKTQTDQMRKDLEEAKAKLAEMQAAQNAQAAAPPPEPVKGKGQAKQAGKKPLAPPPVKTDPTAKPGTPANPVEMPKGGKAF